MTLHATGTTTAKVHLTFEECLVFLNNINTQYANLSKHKKVPPKNLKYSIKVFYTSVKAPVFLRVTCWTYFQEYLVLEKENTKHYQATFITA